MSRERCQGDMGDSDYTERAFRAYFRAGANIQPSASSSGWRGEDPRIAQEMLQAQWEALTHMRWHRQLIRDEIARLSPGSNVSVVWTTPSVAAADGRG